MPRSFVKYLGDLCTACDRIQEFIGDSTAAEFENNALVQSAVERQFTILGEAVRQMREHHADRMSAFPEARQIIGFRNVVIHEYLYVDVESMWSAVKTDIPGLRTRVAELQRTLLEAGEE